MRTTCKRYFVDPSLLNSGVPVEQLEKSEEMELPHAYEALLSLHEVGAKTNKETARKWIEAISTPSKAPRGAASNG